MPEKPLRDIWISRDFPVLVEITRRLDEGDRTVSVQDIAQQLDMPKDDVVRARLAVERRGLVETMGVAELPVLRFKNLSGDAYLLTGLHPEPEAGADRLMAALEKAIADAPEGERKSALVRGRDGLTKAGRDVIIG